jgi:hypothetical protein
VKILIVTRYNNNKLTKKEIREKKKQKSNIKKEITHSRPKLTKFSNTLSLICFNVEQKMSTLQQ